MDTGAAVLLQCIFNGSISMPDMEIERRPYHRYCSCALHRLNTGMFFHYSQRRHISFRKKQVERGGSLSLPATETPLKRSLLSASDFSSHSLIDKKKMTIRKMVSLQAGDNCEGIKGIPPSIPLLHS